MTYYLEFILKANKQKLAERFEDSRSRNYYILILGKYIEVIKTWEI